MVEDIKKRLLGITGPHKAAHPAYPETQTCMIYDKQGHAVCETYTFKDSDFFGHAYGDIKFLLELVEKLQDDLSNASHQPHSSNSNY